MDGVKVSARLALSLLALGGMLCTASCGDTTAPLFDQAGNRIAFIADGNVASMQEDGSNRTMLTHEAFDLTYFGVLPPLQWSPDGKRLAVLLHPQPLDEEIVIVAA